jgi:CRP-like cAMP-binding protein
MFGLGTPCEKPGGTHLFRQGMTPSEVYLVEKGVVKLVRLSDDAREMIVGLRSKGAVLGAASIIVQKPHQVTAVTLTDCSLRRMPLQIFLELAKTNPQISWFLLQEHSREVYEQAGYLVGLRYLSARQRLEQLIWQLSFSFAGNRQTRMLRFQLPLKFWEMAQLVGITPEHLSRVLKQVEEEGLVCRENGCFVIPDLNSLYHTDNI